VTAGGPDRLDRFSFIVATLVVAVWAVAEVLRFVFPGRPDVPSSVTVPMGLVCGFLYGRPIIRNFRRSNGENGG